MPVEQLLLPGLGLPTPPSIQSPTGPEVRLGHHVAGCSGATEA